MEAGRVKLHYKFCFVSVDEKLFVRSVSFDCQEHKQSLALSAAGTIRRNHNDAE